MPNIPDDSLERLWYLRREVDRIFREFFDLKKSNREGISYVDVPIDVHEYPDQIVICAEVAGVDKNEVGLFIQRDIILLEGLKRAPKSIEKTAGKAHLSLERNYGPFRRIIELPKAADTSKCSATLKDGLLVITVPKITDRRGVKRRVEIE